MKLTHRHSQILKASLIVVLALGMMACGSSKRTADSTEFASRSAPTTITANPTKPLAYCNDGSGRSNGFKFRMKVFVGADGKIRNDLLNVRLLTVPSGFEDSTSYFQMYRWLANSSGAVDLDATPIAFDIYDPTTGQKLLTNRTYLRWNDVSTAASGLGLTSAADFFNRVLIIADIRDPLAQYDVLKVIQYTNSDSTKIEEGDALIPAFDANPSAYAVESDGSPRSQVLQLLHPFASMATQGWSADQFLTFSNNMCQGM